MTRHKVFRALGQTRHMHELLPGPSAQPVTSSHVLIPLAACSSMWQ